jgi:uncharacterized RDD family membrane protein YckC
VYFAILFAVSVLIIVVFFSSSYNKFANSEFVKSLTFFFYLILIFVLQWGYYFALEMLFNGKTIGKMILGLRTINYEGEYLDFKSCFLRNFFRVFDVYMTFCLGAFFCMIINKDFRRIGDLAANTIVIRESKFNIPVPDFTIQNTKVQNTGAVRLTKHLSEKELYIIRQFLNSIDKFAPEKKKDLAEKLARSINERLNDTEAIEDPIKYLQSVYLRHKDE